MLLSLSKNVNVIKTSVLTGQFIIKETNYIKYLNNNGASTKTSGLVGFTSAYVYIKTLTRQSTKTLYSDGLQIL